MKQYIIKVAQDLEQGTITEDKARSLLLGLFGVSGSLQPLTINNVSKMLDRASKETWVAVQGDEHGWKEWWKNRNRLYINSNDR
jgi:hypothetical protein